MIKFILPILFLICSISAIPSFYKIGKFNNDVWIKDPDNILTENQIIQLNRYIDINSYFKSHVFNLKNNKYYPYHFGILIKKNSDGYESGYYSEEFFNYAGIGNTDVNNGVLLSIYLDDEELNFVLGKGLDNDDISYSDMEDIIESGFDWIHDDTYYGVKKMIQKTVDKLLSNGKSNYKWSLIDNNPTQNEVNKIDKLIFISIFFFCVLIFINKN